MMAIRAQRAHTWSRFRWMARVGYGSLAVIFLFYYSLQVVNGSTYRELAENNRLREVPLDPARGVITDSQGRILAQNVPNYRLLLNRERGKVEESTLEFVSKVLAVPRAKLEERIASTSGSREGILLAERLSLKEVALIEVEGLSYPNLTIQASRRRLYRHGSLAAHVLGYLGEVSPQELAANSNLKPGDMVGRNGLEKQYDNLLRGSPGQQIAVVDSRGRIVEQYPQKQATTGRDIALTLNADLQTEAERQLEGKVGAVVALDPYTGAILAAASAPTFDPNLFAEGIQQGAWQDLLNIPEHPMQNRTIQSAYSPGSPFKILMALAALEEGVSTPSRRIYCQGSTRFYNRRFRCWKASGHGWVDLHKAIKESCDIYFYQVGDELGIETIAKWARLFGFGTASGIDIRNERSGLVPDTAWKREARGARWYPGETISVAIGQGPFLVTPLQMARALAAVANGGYLVQPHLRRRPMKPKTDPIKVSGDSLTLVRQALWAVVNDRGTGAAARLEGVDVAGKTGTVQVVEQKTWVDNEDLPFEHRDHAWFVSFAPSTQPELVVVVFVEHGGKGSKAAAPIARALYEKYFTEPTNPS